MIGVDLTFRERSRTHLLETLLKLETNPYSDYDCFETQIDNIIKSTGIPDEVFLKASHKKR
jgi:hypothetical protein